MNERDEVEYVGKMKQAPLIMNLRRSKKGLEIENKSKKEPKIDQRGGS